LFEALFEFVQRYAVLGLVYLDAFVRANLVQDHDLHPSRVTPRPLRGTVGIIH